MPRFSNIELQEILARSKAVNKNRTTDGLPPPAPAAPTAASVNYGVQITMTSVTPDIFGFYVYRKLTNDPNTSTLIAAVSAGENGTAIYIDFSGSLGVGYYYWVKAVDWSRQVSDSYSPASALTASAIPNHSSLGSILGANPLSSNATLDKHVSNAMVKGYKDHGDATTGIHGVSGALAPASTLNSHISATTTVHGTSSAVAGISDTQDISNKKLMNLKANGRAESSNYNVTDDDLAMAGTAPMTFFLPAGSTGRVFAFKNIASAGSTVTITAAGANTIEGVGSITLAQGVAAVLFFGNSQWYTLTG